MTEEQILQLAENFKFCRHDEDDIRDWKVTPSLILEFARSMYEEGYGEGYDEGYNNCSLDSSLDMGD
jgi:hypothetical protein